MSREYLDAAASIEAHRALLLTCADCEQPFVLTVAEQEWFRQRELTLPRRCKPCRRLRRLSEDRGPDPSRRSG